MPTSSDHNLLVGILALQMDFVQRDQLLSAMNAWVMRKETPLEQVFLELGALTQDTAALLKALVAKHLELHGNNAQQSLQAISSFNNFRTELKSLGDADVYATLSHMSVTPAAGHSENKRSMKSKTSENGDSESRFRVIRPHAKGGLGEVFVARDAELNREVALKEIQEQFASNLDSRSRFMLEAEVTGSLEHPGIVPVYGLGQYADGRPFYAMRFIKGDSLKDAIDRFHLRFKYAKNLTSGDAGVEFRKLLGRFVDVCEAIEYAHSRGVLHRDLKPGNIMLGKYGETLVVDWGLAKVLGRAEQHQWSDETTLAPDVGSGSASTQMGSAVGTPAFMSPEQAAGRVDELGTASDVYSLGATLYCLLTGKAPFSGKPNPTLAGLLEMVKRGQYQRPKEMKSLVPTALEAVCLKSMALIPKNRYVSPRTLADDIERWLADEPVRAFREGRVERATRWSRKHRAWAMSGAVALALVAVVATFSLVFIISQNQAIIKQTRLAEHHLYDARMKLAQAAWDSDNVDETRRLLELSSDATQRSSGTEDLRGFEWYYWDRLRQIALDTWQLEMYNKQAVCSSNGERLLTLGNDDILRLWDTSNKKKLVEIELRNQGYFGGAVAISFDGGVLATVCSEQLTDEEMKKFSAREIESRSRTKTVIVWNGSGRELFKLEGFADLTEIDISGNGKILAVYEVEKISEVWEVGKISTVYAQGKSVKLFDASTGEKIRDLPLEIKNSNDFFLSPDGREVFVIDSSHGVRVFDVDMGNGLRDWKTKDMLWATIIAISPDGKRYAQYNSTKRTVEVLDAQTGASVLSLTGHTSRVNQVAWSMDGQRMATASDDQTVRIWNATTGEELLLLRGHTGPVISLAFTRDRQRLVSASSDNTFKVWDAVQGQDPQVLSRSEFQVLSVAFHADGKQLASSSGWNGEAKIWDVTSGAKLHVLPGHEGLISVAFSPDGKWLAAAAGRNIHVWNSTNGESVRRLDHSGVKCIAFAADGNRMASSGDDGMVRLWDTKTWMELRAVGEPGHYRVHCIAFHPNSSRFAVASDESLKLFDVGSSNELLNWNSHQANSLAYSPDGKRLATASSDKTIRLWNAVDGQLLFICTGHASTVNCVVFSPDGQRLASASDDRTVRIWDVSTGMETLSLKGHTDRVHCVAFSPDGRQLASGSGGTIRIWDARPASVSIPEQIKRSAAQFENRVGSIQPGN